MSSGRDGDKRWNFGTEASPPVGKSNLCGKVTPQGCPP